MARQIKVSSGLLNIALHPHSPDIYASFIDALFALKRPVRLRGDRYGIISLVHRDRSDDGFVSGVITTFIRLDMDGNWFDADRLTDATDSQINKINIPDNLYPNAAAFYFSFDIEKHRLYFQTYSHGKNLSTGQAFKLFSELAEDMRIQAIFGRPKISVVQSHNGLSTLFALPRINEIRIAIQRPNPDVFDDDFEREIEEELAASHSREVTISFRAEPGQSVIPTASIRRASEAALDNGRVTVRGRDENGAVERSTDEFPRILQARYDPDVESEDQAFRQLVRRGSR
jgi:hypothetical protein